MPLKEPSAFFYRAHCSFKKKKKNIFFLFFRMGHIPMLFREQQKDSFEHQNHKAAV